MRNKNHTIELVFGRKPYGYRNMRAERFAKRQKAELRNNLGWVAVGVILAACYMLVGSAA